MIWSELNYIAICLCNKDPDFIFLLNRLSFFQCLLPWVPWQGIIQWIHSPVEKELSKSPVWLIDDGKELPEFILFIKVFVVTKVFVVSNVLRWIESYLACRAWLLACTKVSGVFSQYILRSRSLWNPLSSRMLKNMQIFLLIISKFLSLYNLV